MAAPNENTYIRAAQLSDAPAMARIMFLTGDAGASAEGKMNFEELPGLVYLYPYVAPLQEGGERVKGTTGFVLVDRRPVSSKPGEAEERNEKDIEEVRYEEVVVGYSLLSADSIAYRDATEKYWWPSLRARFPLSLPNGESPENSSEPRTPLDQYYVDRIHHPRPFPPECLAFSPAHMHINILPAYHRKGWGRKLVAAVVEHARTIEKLDGVFLGFSPANVNAAQFYNRIGFRNEHVEGAPWNYIGLKFEEFV
ncbi:hypothetical protein SCHPADRAFT_705707 [Schizopora paradoxa]|uniref:N-acetyltransferase domain-containing protein n=1 Tax=Schizopora paradoxa TaxID=27342 RepID=A0A0H2R2H0_9AGAM|nr:hypothetical protein SCHPADRAFT_705707 [Schizopora paradoxa]